MHPNLAASFQFRQVLRSVDGLPEARRILVLEIELLHALKRVSHSQRRNHLLERELAKSTTEGQERLRAMQLELLSMQVQCKTLEELCRSLLLTIEHAACSELGAAADPEHKAGVSS